MKKMEEIKRNFLLGLTTLGGFISYLVGGYDTIFVTLLMFMLIDFILGWSIAKHNKKLESDKMAKGGRKKAMVIILVIIAHRLNIEFFREGVIMFFTGVELLSIFEHMVAMEVPLPKFLVKYAQSLKDTNDEEVGGK